MTGRGLPGPPLAAAVGSLVPAPRLLDCFPSGPAGQQVCGPGKVSLLPPGQRVRPRRDGEGGLQYLVRPGRVPGTLGTGGGGGCCSGTCSPPTRGNLAAPFLFSVPLFLPLSNGGLYHPVYSPHGETFQTAVFPGEDEGHIRHCMRDQAIPGHGIGVLLWPCPVPQPYCECACLERDHPSHNPRLCSLTVPFFGAVHSFREGPRGQAVRGLVSGA